MNRALIRAGLAAMLAAAPFYSPLAHAGDDDEEAAESVTETVSRGNRDRQVQRVSGQTQFLNATQNYGGAVAFGAAAGLESGGAADGAMPRGALQSGTAKREVTESDVFAVDPETGTLFVLNSQRGLQAISKGNEPLGRAPATGNRPDNMYPVFKGGVKRLVVLEQDYQRRFDDQAGTRAGAAKLQLVTYDVSDPSNPKMIQTVALEGTLADSRMVGDVLYIAASVYPEGNRYGYYNPEEEKKAKGRVYSVKVTGEKLEVVNTHDIGLPQVSAEMMQIVETPVGKDKFTYHLLALTPGDQMSKREWSWERGSEIEVVDITDPAGKAVSVFKTRALGHIARKNQITLKDGYLVAVSNYVAKDGDWNSIVRRVAMQSWKLPTKGVKAISAQEAKYRMDTIDRELVRINDEDEKDAKRAELLAGVKSDAAKDTTVETTLLGKFVRGAEGAPLTKLVADSQATTGDTTGQSASLRDVRFHGDLGIAAWVPGNLVDPLDLFTIIDGKVVYLNRTEFDGWIESFRILEHDGRKFILGLGFTVPATSERSRRYPQAKLFELVKDGDKVVAKAVAEHVIKDKNMWPSLSGPDKYLDVRVNGQGEGSAMFTVATHTKTGYVQGGKLLGFDLAAAVAGKADKVFTEGALLAGSADYLRRIFVDSVTLRRLAFSDKQLTDYGTVSKGVGSAKEIREAVAKLELARNIQGYVTMGTERTLGVQIVSDENFWWGNQGAQNTELRLVADSHADAERAQTKAIATLPGTYVAHTVVDHGAAQGDRRYELVVLVRRQEVVGEEEDADQDPWQAQYNKKWETKFEVYSVFETKGELVSRKAADWSHEGPYYGGYYGGYYGSRRPALGILTTLDDGSVVISAGDKLQRITYEDWSPQSVKVAGAAAKVPFPSWQLADFVIEGAPKNVSLQQAIIPLGGKAKDGEFALTWQTPVTVQGEDPATSSLSYHRKYIATLKTKDGRFVVGKPVNIPGEPVARMAGAFLITEDSIFQDRAVDPEAEIDLGTLTPASSKPTASGFIGGRFRPNRTGVIFDQQLMTTKVTATGATLVDVKPADGRTLSTYKQLGALGPLVTFKAAVNNGGGIYPLYGMGIRGGGMPWYGTPQPANLEMITVDEKGALRFSLRAANGLTLTDYPQIIETYPADRQGEFYTLVMEGNRLQVLAIDARTGQTELMGIIPVNERGIRAAEPVAVSFVPHGYWWSMGRNTTYNPATRSLVVTSGLAGACQFYLAEEGKKVTPAKPIAETAE